MNHDLRRRATVRQPSMLRLVHALPLAFGLAMVWPEPVDAERLRPAVAQPDCDVAAISSTSSAARVIPSL
jgi:hypothetical protein